MSTPSEKLFNGAGGGRGMIAIFGGIAMIENKIGSELISDLR